MSNLVSRIACRVLAAVFALSVGMLSAGDVAAQTAVSVAVLPLANASGDPNQDALAEGLTEEIAAALANVPGLDVGARSSAFRFKASPRDIRAIGESLKKTHLVEGSVRKVDDRVRLSARLVRAADGVQLWSEDYYTPFAEIFDIQDAIARSVATALQVRVRHGPGAKPHHEYGGI